MQSVPFEFPLFLIIFAVSAAKNFFYHLCSHMEYDIIEPRKYIALVPGQKGFLAMSDIRNQILELFLHLTAEQQELAFDFVQSMLGVEQEEAPAVPE